MAETEIYSNVFTNISTKNMADCNKHWNGSFNVLTVFYRCQMWINVLSMFNNQKLNDQNKLQK